MQKPDQPSSSAKKGGRFSELLSEKTCNWPLCCYSLLLCTLAERAKLSSYKFRSFHCDEKRFAVKIQCFKRVEYPVLRAWEAFKKNPKHCTLIHASRTYAIWVCPSLHSEYRPRSFTVVKQAAPGTKLLSSCSVSLAHRSSCHLSHGGSYLLNWTFDPSVGHYREKPLGEVYWSDLAGFESLPLMNNCSILKSFPFTLHRWAWVKGITVSNLQVISRGTTPKT